MGVLNPLLVRFLPDSGKYGIISGQRRYQAASAAGLSEVPCIEKDVDDAEAIEIALTENLHHKDLTPSDQAVWIHELARLGMTQEEIARRVGKLPLSINSSSVGPHPETAEAMISMPADRNSDNANDAVCLAEDAEMPEHPASVETYFPTAARLWLARAQRPNLRRPGNPRVQLCRLTGHTALIPGWCPQPRVCWKRPKPQS